MRAILSVRDIKLMRRGYDPFEPPGHIRAYAPMRIRLKRLKAFPGKRRGK